MVIAATAAAAAASVVVQASSAVAIPQLAAVALNLMAHAVALHAVGQTLLVMVATAVVLQGAHLATAAQAAAAVNLESTVAGGAAAMLPMVAVQTPCLRCPAALAVHNTAALTSTEATVVLLDGPVAALDAVSQERPAVLTRVAAISLHKCAVPVVEAVVIVPLQRQVLLTWMLDTTLIPPLPGQLAG